MKCVSGFTSGQSSRRRTTRSRSSRYDDALAVTYKPSSMSHDIIKSLICIMHVRTNLASVSAGFHLEGPFISVEKKGAHPEQFLRSFQSGGLVDLMETYGGLDDVAMVTLAPELAGSESVVRALCQRGITVSLGEPRCPDHMTRTAFRFLIRCLLWFSWCRSLGGQPVSGRGRREQRSLVHHSSVQRHVACESTHCPSVSVTCSCTSSMLKHVRTVQVRCVFALVQFHHRDPGIVGLLTSDRVPSSRTVFYGMIADGIHTNPAALRIAHRAHPSGQSLLLLVQTGRLSSGSSVSQSVWT